MGADYTRRTTAMRNGIVLEPPDVQELLRGKPLTFNLNGHEFDVWAVGLDSPGKRLANRMQGVLQNGQTDAEVGVIDRIEPILPHARNGKTSTFACTCGKTFRKLG